MTRTAVGRIIRFAMAAAVATSCTNTSPKSSGLTLPSAAGSGVGTLSGKVTSYTTGSAISGVTVRLAGVTGITDGTGAFTLSGTPDTGSAIIIATLPGYVYRGVAFSLLPSRSGLTMDLLPDGGPFNLTFYRQFVRNGFASSTLEAIQRWTVNPNFYFQQVDADDATVRVPDSIIQAIEANWTASVPELSGGQRAVGTFEVGDAARDARDGWVNVVFNHNIPGGVLGFSTVGGNSGTITIRYDPTLLSSASSNPYNCSSVSLAIADHEITHTMGYWHTENVLVDTFSGNGCPGSGRTDLARFHAAVTYSRPVGNIDPDVDTTSSAHSTAPGPASRRVVVCDLGTFRRR